MSTVKLTSAPTNFDFTKKTVTGDVTKGSSRQLDLYSYTGRVKFFDKDKGFGYIQEIPDTKNLKDVVKEWRVTAEQLGAAEIHRGDFVYFMKQGKTIGEISPINLRDLLKTPCPECGRRDYVPGKDSCCPNCGRRAWKRYGYHQNISCRCCGTKYPGFFQKLFGEFSLHV